MTSNDTPTQLYRHFNENGELLYVGISINHMARLAQHRDAAQWFDDILEVKVERFPSRKAARQAEKDAIKNENPKYNIQDKIDADSLEEINKNARLIRLEEEQKALARIVLHKALYTISEAAEILGIGNQKLRELAKAEEIAHIVWRSRLNKNGIEYNEYRFSAWQIIAHLEKIGAFDLDGHAR